MAFPPENLKIWVNSREIHAFIPTATYPPFTKGTSCVVFNFTKEDRFYFGPSGGCSFVFIGGKKEVLLRGMLGDKVRANPLVMNAPCSPRTHTHATTGRELPTAPPASFATPAPGSTPSTRKRSSPCINVTLVRPKFPVNHTNVAQIYMSPLPSTQYRTNFFGLNSVASINHLQRLLG